MKSPVLVGLAPLLLFCGCSIFSQSEQFAGIYLAESTQEKELSKLVTVTLNADQSAELVSKSEDGLNTETQTGQWESDGEHVITLRLNDHENRPIHRSIVFRFEENELIPLILDRKTYGSGEVKLRKNKVAS